nr:W1 peptide [Psophocarpus tetragonolobus=winged-beans, PT4912, seeds, Peptide Partial, 11 aa] [Psophocarpus tetragonolobus]
VSPTVPPVLLV